MSEALEEFQKTCQQIIDVAGALNVEQMQSFALHHGFLGALQVLQNVAWHIRHHTNHLPSG